ncbi:hypothetical protein J437_LFUL015887 [Ladona fulva]|uniref:SUMO-activating enzyme subunit 1 n=1 Tax=Ladona fulva TaxID=123851 RepID=A0A8K0JVK6_LADFU|nr:hypothetical protein J437_LFUL015887 [Ladona fulva]
MVEANSGHELTEDEAALYDRQIRLWGVDAQKRLRAAKILLVGLKGLGSEVCKNVMLAGVKSITLLDHEPLKEEDFGSQFLAPRSEVGKNRAEASVARARRLNPMVEVKIAPPAEGEAKSDPSLRPDSFFSEFQIVIATGLGAESLKRLNQVCRRVSTDKNKVCLIAGDVFGFHGYIFSDLQEHVHLEQTKSIIHGKDKGDAVPSTENIKKLTHFVPIEEPLSINWDSGNTSNVHDSFFLVQVLLAFIDENGHTPRNMESDFSKLQEVRDKKLSSIGVPPEKVPDSALRKSFGEVCPVCAVVGGFLTQELVKAVSHMGSPFNNFLLFEPELCEGIVCRIAKERTHGKSKGSKKKDYSSATSPAKKMKV